MKATSVKKGDLRIWKSENGTAVLVQEGLQKYPDFMLDKILKKAGILYRDNKR